MKATTTIVMGAIIITGLATSFAHASVTVFCNPEVFDTDVVGVGLLGPPDFKPGSCADPAVQAAVIRECDRRAELEYGTATPDEAALAEGDPGIAAQADANAKCADLDDTAFCKPKTPVDLPKFFGPTPRLRESREFPPTVPGEELGPAIPVCRFTCLVKAPRTCVPDRS